MAERGSIAKGLGALRGDGAVVVGTDHRGEPLGGTDVGGADGIAAASDRAVSAGFVRDEAGGGVRCGRVALAHDWLYTMRGGEAVLDRLARLVLRDHEAGGLYVLVDAGGKMTEPIDRFGRVTSFLQSMPMATGAGRRWYLPLFPAAVDALGRTLRRHHGQRPIDLLLSTSSSAIKGLRAPEGVPHVCYCHSPARYVWAMPEQYGGGRLGALRRVGLGAFSGSFKRWDARTAAHVTRFIANSETTRARILACFGRESDVVYPPVRTGYFTPGEADSADLARVPDGLPCGVGEYWLLVGALEPYKRVDIAIHAANRAHLPLVVAGTGSMFDELRGLAGPTVRMVGRVDDGVLRSLYRGARGLWFPQEEDFGIVAVEAMSCGVAVLAYGKGGATESVVEGETGALFTEPTPGSLLDGLGRMPGGPGVREACVARAALFAEEVFDAKMADVIADAMAR